MNCAPAFNYKIGNAAHSGVSEVLFVAKSYNWKKQRWEKWATGRQLLETMCFWRCPTVGQFKMAERRMRAQQKLKLLDVAWQCPDYSLLFHCNNSFAESSVTCLRNKAYVYFKNSFEKNALANKDIYWPSLVFNRHARTKMLCLISKAIGFLSWVHIPSKLCEFW